MVEAKQLQNGMNLVRINLEMSIEGFEEAPPTVEIIQLSVFGKKAAILKRKLDEGDNYAMITADVRCRPYKNKDGVTKAFPSFNVRNIVTERRNEAKAHDPDGFDDGADQVPF
jgi:single-stranded DNA-binding protein